MPAVCTQHDLRVTEEEETLSNLVSNNVLHLPLIPDTCVSVCRCIHIYTYINTIVFSIEDYATMYQTQDELTDTEQPVLILCCDLMFL